MLCVLSVQTLFWVTVFNNNQKQYVQSHVAELALVNCWYVFGEMANSKCHGVKLYIDTP